MGPKDVASNTSKNKTKLISIWVFHDTMEFPCTEISSDELGSCIGKIDVSACLYSYS